MDDGKTRTSLTTILGSLHAIAGRIATWSGTTWSQATVVGDLTAHQACFLVHPRSRSSSNLFPPSCTAALLLGVGTRSDADGHLLARLQSADAATYAAEPKVTGRQPGTQAKAKCLQLPNPEERMTRRWRRGQATPGQAYPVLGNQALPPSLSGEGTAFGQRIKHTHTYTEMHTCTAYYTHTERHKQKPAWRHRTGSRELCSSSSSSSNIRRARQIKTDQDRHDRHTGRLASRQAGRQAGRKEVGGRSGLPRGLKTRLGIPRLRGCLFCWCCC